MLEAARNAHAQGLTLISTVEPGLPPILVDPQQINHVFNNYILNAIKHSPARRKFTSTPPAPLRATSNSASWIMGREFPNIRADLRPLLSRSDQAKTGVGLGLSIAREIVVAHGDGSGSVAYPGRE